MTLPLLGPPDMYYTYRRGDIYMKGVEQGSPFLRTGDSFTLKSDPAARIRGAATGWLCWLLSWGGLPLPKAMVR